MRETALPAACPPGEELTALAHGDVAGAARATLLRHVLGCAPCRAQHHAAQRVLLALRGLGAARAAHAPLPRPRRRVFGRGLGAVGLVPPLVAAAAVALALIVPLGGREGASPPPAPSAAAPRAPAAAPPALLASQQPDGRWTADPDLAGGQGSAGGDETATGLVLLALLQPGADALRQDPVARAVAAASRWLGTRAEALAGSLPSGPDAVRARAVAAAALLKAGQLTRDATLVPALQVLLPALARDASSSAGDHAARPWLDFALAQARESGWRSLDDTRRTLASAAPASAPPRERSQAPARERASSAPASPLRLALATLRDEVPVRLLAQGLATFSLAPSDPR